MLGEIPGSSLAEREDAPRQEITLAISRLESGVKKF
jgi:hypothetical protein